MKKATVEVEGRQVAGIGAGLAVLVGLAGDDSLSDVSWMIDKIINLRIFEKEGKFDRSLLDVDGELLLVSQFTLYGDCSKGRRPSFTRAMDVEKARDLFAIFVEEAKKRVPKVKSGIFQASMDVSLTNEGPVTIIIDSP